MLGEMSSDIKTILKSHDAMWKNLATSSDRIDNLEKKEVARVARAGVFGAFGGVVVTAFWSLIKSKFL